VSQLEPLPGPLVIFPFPVLCLSEIGQQSFVWRAGCNFNLPHAPQANRQTETKTNLQWV